MNYQSPTIATTSLQNSPTHIPVRQRILEANEFINSIITKYDNFDSRLNGGLPPSGVAETKPGPRDIDAELDTLFKNLNCLDSRIERLSRIA